MATMARADAHTRIFILGGKGASEQEFRDQFGKFGSIKDIWIVKDKVTNEDRGVVYITYEKASEAALAIEEMNGRALGHHPKSLKVLMANDRKDGSVRDQKEDERMMRLFIKVPKSTTEKDLEKVFKEYGDIDYVSVIKDKVSGESKGLAYVKYHRAYHAALALENCDPSYKPVFAQTPTARKSYSESSNGKDRYSERYAHEDLEIGPAASTRGHTSRYDRDRAVGPSASFSPVEMVQRGGGCDRGNMETRLEVMTTSAVSQEQLYKLLDLIPGMDYCDFDRHACIAYVRYTSPQCAAYAREKLNGFEYPPGYRLSARFAGERAAHSYTGDVPMEIGGYPGASDLNEQMTQLTQGPIGPENLQSLVGVVKKAMGMLEAAGFNVNQPSVPPSMAGGGGGGVRVKYCDIPLPERQPLMPRDSSVGERLFVVSQPEAFPERILQDCLCRFGNLIDAYFMPGRNFGYAKFGSKDNAQLAIDTMHGQMVCGNRLKVMLADPPKYEDHDSSAKKQRT